MAFYFIPLPEPPNIVQGGSGGGGVTIGYRDKPIPKVKIKVINDVDNNINITVVRVIDLSLNIGGT